VDLTNVGYKVTIASAAGNFKMRNNVFILAGVNTANLFVNSGAYLVLTTIFTSILTALQYLSYKRCNNVTLAQCSWRTGCSWGEF